MNDSRVNPHRIGEAFQEGTKYFPDRPVRSAGYDAAPERKVYPDAKRFQLPSPKSDGGAALWDVVAKRRSVRAYADAPVSLDELSQLLWAAQGVTAEMGGHKFRATPSAGALYPCETYVVANRVDGVDSGVYHYEVHEHELALLKPGEFGHEAAAAACGQAMCARAACVFIWTAVIPRCGAKYRQRAFRYVYLDAGHIAQDVALAAVALGLGSCQIAAFFDDKVNAIVGADGRAEAAVYMTSVGRAPKQI